MAYSVGQTTVVSAGTTAQTVTPPRTADLGGNGNTFPKYSHALIRNAHATQIVYIRRNYNGGAVEAASSTAYDYAMPGVSEIVISLSDPLELSVIASGATTPVYIHWGKFD
jgi:hypothetical protein